MTAVRAVGAAPRENPGGLDQAVVDRAAALESPVTTLLPESLLNGVTNSVALVPDMGYPHRPSTGLVTDPAVTTAVADRIASVTDCSIELVGRDGDHFDLETTAQFLGYRPLLERDPVELHAIDETIERTELWTQVSGRSVTVDIPSPLLERTVVPIPTLRPTRDGALAGVTRLLGHLAAPDRYAPDSLTATVDTVAPPWAVLDAITTFAGDPVTTNTLVAGPPIAVDLVAERLLDREAQAVSSTTLDDVKVRCEDVDLESVAAAIPDGDYPSAQHSPVLARAYRLYTHLTGDAMPPHLDPDR